MRDTGRDRRRSLWIALLLLPACLWAVVARTDAPSDADRDRAIRIQKEAVERLRDGAKAGRRRGRRRLRTRPRGSGPEDRGLDRDRVLAARLRARFASAHGRGARDASRRRTAGVLAGRGPRRARSRGLPAARGHRREAGVRGQLLQEQAGRAGGARLWRPRDGHGAAAGGGARGHRARPGQRGALRPGPRPADRADLRGRSLQVAPRRVRGATASPSSTTTATASSTSTR